ncbi:hypothetical protein BJX99DRAFT_242010 [Aspergillus californicus]
MARRAHKKSRNGCLECKRRHVKCDEKRPICSNCIAAERVCEFSSIRFCHVSPGTPVSAPSPIESSTASVATPLATTPPVASPTASEDLPVNMLHVELFHNLFTATHSTFYPFGPTTWLPELISTAISTPYLVNEMLAFSALHLSTTRPNQRDFYQYHAAQLQTHALAIFQESNPQVTHETCVPLVLFSTTLGIHMLCDTLIYRENNFDTFLTRFVHYLRLHHGVRTIIAQSWIMLNNSLLKDAFAVGSALYHADGRMGPTCEKLRDLVTAANLGPELTEVYQQAVQSLQSCINVTNANNVHHPAINGLISWPVLIQLEFSDHLEMRRPEAMVILAHYAVLLHRYRDSWLLGNSGAFIIEEVTRCLGKEWEEWLQWPIEALRS